MNSPKLKIKEHSNSIEFVYGDAVPQEDAQQIQFEAGYDPRGYGFFNYSNPDPMTTVWRCYLTCD